MATVTVDIKGIAEACGSLEAAQAKIAAGIAAGVARRYRKFACVY